MKHAERIEEALTKATYTTAAAVVIFDSRNLWFMGATFIAAFAQGLLTP